MTPVLPMMQAEGCRSPSGWLAAPIIWLPCRRSFDDLAELNASLAIRAACS